MSRSLCFNTSTDQVCLQVTPLSNGEVLQTQVGVVGDVIDQCNAKIAQLRQQGSTAQLQQAQAIEQFYNNWYGEFRILSRFGDPTLINAKVEQLRQVCNTP